MTSCLHPCTHSPFEKDFSLKGKHVLPKRESFVFPFILDHSVSEGMQISSTRVALLESVFVNP